MIVLLRPIRIEGGIAYVPLTRGKEAIIDACEVYLVGDVNWFAQIDRTTNNFYASRNVRKENGRGSLLMHRLILGLTDPAVFADHINLNTLDNRRSNLRSCTPAESARNQGLRKDNTTGFKGVHFDKINRNYMTYVTIRGVRHARYAFPTAEDAFKARQEMLKLYHGEFFCAG